MKLPRLYAITGRTQTPSGWWDRFENLIAAGYSLIQLRCPEDDPASLEHRARQAAEVCRSAGVQLLLNGPVSLVRRLDLPGVHLRANVLMSLEDRPLSSRRLVGASCHSAAELAQAQHIGVDFACLSPVRPTASHPGAAILGWEQFGRLVSECEVPVFALGGVGPGDIAAARQAGGYGVAGISAFWA